jgi:predicted ATPase
MDLHPIKTSSLSGRASLGLRLENFRLFRDSGWFRLAPLTCLVGRNSSGKSSVISSILLLKQSLEQQAMGTAQTPLTLSGPYCDLGNYSDVVHDHNESSEMSFSFSASMFDLRSGLAERRSQIVELSIPRPSTIRPYMYFSRYINVKLLPKRGSVEMRLTFSADKRFGPSLSRCDIEVTDLGTASFVRTTGIERRQHWRVYTSSLPRHSLTFRPPLRSFFPVVDIKPASYGHSAPKTKHHIRAFITACHSMFRFISDTVLLSDITGPFRTPPERRYAFGGFSASRSGPTGEQAIDLLITEALLRPAGHRPLHKALSFWIKHLGLAQSLDVRDLAKRLNLFEVDIKGARQGTKANLADVGFGISQVLPVLIQGLLMRRRGIYLVQQPEIHLHPDAQAGLADFFIFLASQGVITVVETHSEYLLLRLRRRLAEGSNPISSGGFGLEHSGPLTVNDVAVLLTGSDRKESAVRQLGISDSFQFENLPRGFMSEALDDRIALLNALGKRNA